MRVLGLICAVTTFAAVGCGPGGGGGSDGGTDPNLATVTVTGEKTTLAVNEHVQLTATGKDGAGAEVSLDSVTWSSSDDAVLTVDADGVVTGKRTGAATVTATSGGKSGTLELKVEGALHGNETIATSQTWREADNPHRVVGDIDLEGAGSPVLTIEAGVQVFFETGAGLDVGRTGEGGTLRVEGTTEKPVLFTSAATAKAPGQWRGINFYDGTTASSVTHATLEYCGASSGNSSTDACMVIEGDNVNPVLKDLTIRHSATRGISLTGGGRMGDGSAKLTIEEVADVPVFADANETGSIPATVTFSSNGRNVIAVNGDQIDRTQTWAVTAVPYAVESSTYVDGVGLPTLTLVPGVTLKFGKGAYFEIGYSDGGNLVAVGTAEKPITFTADAASPAPEHWIGIIFEGASTSASQLQHAIVEFGGDEPHDANITVIGDRGAFITDTVIRKTSGCGILREDPEGNGFSTDFTDGTLNNTFTAVGTAQCGPN